MPAAVWGLDIGHSSIKAVQMERTGSIAEVTSFDVIEIEPSEDESTRPARVHRALAELLGRRRIAGNPVLVAVAGNQALFKPFSLPAAPASRLAGIVSFEARNQIPFPINEVLWDYKVIAPGGGGETRVGLVAVRRELVDEILNQVRTLGLRLEGIQVAPLALYNLVNYEFGSSQNWLVLDAGARVTDFVVVDGEEFWFRPLPQSGNDFTRALEEKFRMTFDEADTLKLKMGDSKQSEKLFEVVEPILRNLVGDIQRTVGYYKGLRPGWELGGAGGAKILAVGNSFRLPGLVEFLRETLDVDVAAYDQMRRIRLGVGVDVDWWRDEVASFGVALGLGLQGLGLAHVKMEFLPESVLRARMIRKKQPVVATAVGLALVASVVSLFAARHEKNMIESDLDYIKQKTADIRRDRKAYDEATSVNEKIEAPLKDWAEKTVRERGWVLEAVESIDSFKLADGAALGSHAGDNGIFVSYLRVNRDDPFPRKGPEVDRNIGKWYTSMKAAAGTKPLVFFLQVDVAGPDGTAGRVPPANRSHVLRSLKRAIEGASRIYEIGRETPLVGKVSQTAEERERGVVTYEARDGGTREIALKDVKRLFWFRGLIVGKNWNEEERPLVPRGVAGIMEQEGQPVPARQYLVFRLAWIVDDGGLDLAKDGPRAAVKHKKAAAR